MENRLHRIHFSWGQNPKKIFASLVHWIKNSQHSSRDDGISIVEFGDYCSWLRLFSKKRHSTPRANRSWDFFLVTSRTLLAAWPTVFFINTTCIKMSRSLVVDPKVVLKLSVVRPTAAKIYHQKWASRCTIFFPFVATISWVSTILHKKIFFFALFSISTCVRSLFSTFPHTTVSAYDYLAATVTFFVGFPECEQIGLFEASSLTFLWVDFLINIVNFYTVDNHLQAGLLTRGPAKSRFIFI